MTEVGQELWWLGTDGAMINPMTKDELNIDEVSTFHRGGRIVQIVPVTTNSIPDQEGYGYIALVEFPL